MNAYLVRAKGEWVTDRFSVGAFHRSGRVGFDDPLSLFTDVGPYAYPLDLFCRGAEVAAGWKNSVEGRVFFANRIDRPWVGTDYLPESGRRFVTDKDMIGGSLTGRFGSFRLEYLYRHDRGPENEWSAGDSVWTMISGYESRTSHGLLLEIEKKDWPVLTAQYLTGLTQLIANSIYSPQVEASGTDLSEYDLDWEEGYRALAGISWPKGSFLTLLKWHRTTIERNAEVYDRMIDWEDARMDLYEAGVSYCTERITLDFNIDFLDFSGSGGTGGTFWMNNSNFWLDGDMLRTELFQFIESERMWRATLDVEEGGVEDIPGPYRLEGYLLAKVNWDGYEDRSMFEISGGKGIRAGSYLSLHADLRYVSYNRRSLDRREQFLRFLGRASREPRRFGMGRTRSRYCTAQVRQVVLRFHWRREGALSS